MATMRELIDAFIRGEVAPPIAKLIGFRPVECGSGTARFELQTRTEHFNPNDTVHGGILCDLADAAMGMAFASTLNEGESLATIELKINFFRPVRETRLTADAKVINRGRNTGYVECEITDQQKKLVAKASGTWMVLKREAV